MGPLFWQLVDRTAETEFIFALFHLLLAGLGLLILLRWRGWRSQQLNSSARVLLTLGFSLLALGFATTAARYGLEFFFDRQWNGFLLTGLSHAFAAAAMILSASGLLVSVSETRARRIVVYAAGVCGLMIVPLLFTFGLSPGNIAVHRLTREVTDIVTALAVMAATILLAVQDRKWREPALLSLLFLLSSRLIHLSRLFLDPAWSNLGWHIEEHLLSFSLVTLAWALGERSTNLFDRVFVRLNLSFILLASIMILSTAGMERFQYARLAEGRSMNLAEYLRGYLAFYAGRGETLETSVQRAEVLRRIVVGFGELPDFERIEVFLGGSHAVFRYLPDKTVTQQVGPRSAPTEDTDLGGVNEDTPTRNYFRMIQLPVYPERGTWDRIEFYGGMLYINRYIGSYIVVIYLLFTVMVATSIIVVGIIVRNADVSIQKQHAEIEEIGLQLLQAAKLASIGELAGGVAHEINNPVTGILSTATHLIDKRRDSSLTPRDKQALGLIAEQAERISDIVGKLLTFSRQNRMEYVTCDVNAVVERAISLIEFRLEGSDVTLKRDLTAGLSPVFCDINRITEVFVNLMNNAIDATQPSGTLTVRTGETGNGKIRISVSDTGTGIDPALLQRIFDPFFTTKEPGKGTGLGLSISHGIARGHQGEILVRSTPGQGSTFTVVLPARDS